MGGGVDALEVGQEDAAPVARATITPYTRGSSSPSVQGSLALSTSTEQVERREFVLAHGGEARVVERRGARVARDLGAQARLGRLEGADAAAQLTVLLERDEAGRRRA